MTRSNSFLVIYLCKVNLLVIECQTTLRPDEIFQFLGTLTFQNGLLSYTCL